MKVQSQAECKIATHRLKEVRLREGVSLRSVAKRLRCPVSRVREQETGRCEVTLSDLYRWQKALKVPLLELLHQDEPPLQECIRQRAGLVRVAKTAHYLVKKCRSPSEKGQAQLLVDQLCELMPELREISSWPERRPRPGGDYGRAAEEISIRDWHLD